jgi:hypothetical protein
MMTVHERPLDVGRAAGLAFAAERQRSGVSDVAAGGVQPEEMRAILAEHRVRPDQTIAFVRGFWQAVNNGTAPAPAKPPGMTQPTH